MQVWKKKYFHWKLSKYSVRKLLYYRVKPRYKNGCDLNCHYGYVDYIAVLSCLNISYLKKKTLKKNIFRAKLIHFEIMKSEQS